MIVFIHMGVIKTNEHIMPYLSLGVLPSTIIVALTFSFLSVGSIGIPVVILCLEGGPNTIVTMAEAIKKGVPAVVIDGSGRAADVVAYAYNRMVL